MSREPTSGRSGFKLGDRVRIDSRDVFGHCRSPFYLRGLEGEICGIHGVFRDPERLAYMKPGLPALTLYKVRIPQTAIWPDYAGPQSDDLEVDIYESWLRPANAAERQGDESQDNA